MHLTQLKDYRACLAELVKSAAGLKNAPDLQRQSGGQGLTFAVNKSHIVKFALRPHEVKPLQNTVALLTVLRPYLQHKTPVRVPQVQGVVLSVPTVHVRNGKEAQIYGVVYPMMSGVFHHKSTFAELKNRYGLMEQLGEFIAHLHGFDYRKHAHVPFKDYKSCLMEDMADILEDLEYEKDSFKKRLLNGVCKKMFGNDDNVLCHYDAMPRNICLNADADRITGVIDFGCAVVGPRAFEMTKTDYTKEDLTAFAAGYKHVARRSILSEFHGTPQEYLVKTTCDLYARMKCG